MDAYESVRDVDPPAFRDRTEAGWRLADALAAYRGEDVLILGIPRGGVPVAAALVQGLSAELDVIVARKLGAPFEAGKVQQVLTEFAPANTKTETPTAS